MTPRAREAELVVQHLSDETLVYDLARHQAHCLNPIAARVWRLCDGQTPVAALATRLSKELGGEAAEDVVWLALDQLARAHLLRERPTRPKGSPRHSRREVLRRLGQAALLPAVASIVAPTPAEAQACSTGMNRPDGCPCKNTGDCMPSHHCVGGMCSPRR